LRPVEVALPTGLAEPLALLEEALRDGDPVPEDFADRLRKAVEAGDVEVLAARAEDQLLGVALLAYRLNVSAGGLFASVEELYVRREARRRGVGHALLQAADERCEKRGISYVEAQVEKKKPNCSTPPWATSRRQAYESSPAPYLQATTKTYLKPDTSLRTPALYRRRHHGTPGLRRTSGPASWRRRPGVRYRLRPSPAPRTGRS